MLTKGGARQKELAAQTLDAPMVQTKSKLAQCLLRLFGWGLLPATSVQWLASAAVSDGLIHADLVALAKLGKSGEFAGNTRRDLLRRLEPRFRLCAPFEFLVQFKDIAQPLKQLMLAPSHLVASLWQVSQTCFDTVFGQNPADFWSSVSADDPKLIHLERELAHVPDWRQSTYPYVLHGDAARFTTHNQQSILGIQFKGLLSRNFAVSILPIVAIVKKCCEEDTLKVVWQWVVFFLNALFVGTHPPLDLDGQPWRPGSYDASVAGTEICGGRRLICWSLTGDLEFYSNDLGLPNHGSLEPCWLCACSRRVDTSHPWTDLRDPASWEETIVETEEGIFTEFTRHAVGQLRGLTRFHLCGDFMHTSDLGVAQVMSGSILHELVFEGGLRGARDSRVEQVFRMIKAEYDTMSATSRLGSLTFNMFCRKDQWANLSSKAAESQQLLYALQFVLRRVHDNSDHHEHRIRCLSALLRIYNCFKDGGMFLPRENAEAALVDLRCMYSHWQWLLLRSVARGVLNWAVMPKLHYLFHIVYHSRYLNPRFTWTYEWEDHMRSVVMSAKACMAGSPMHIIGNKVVQNSRLALELTLET